MKNILLLIVGLIFIKFSLNASEEIAKNFLHYKGIQKNISHITELKKENIVVGYLYNLENNGYIIIPISKSLSPIKSYSFDSNFLDLPKEFQDFLIQELYNFVSHKSLSRVIDSEVNDQWSFIENYDSSKRILHKYTAGENLLKTSWNQKYPYNKYLPKINGTNVPAGCVQIAIGQVMNYHGHPLRGSGAVTSSKATNNIIDMKAVLNRYYNWENVPTNTTGIKEYQEDEVGYLIRDLVVLNQASMSSSGTGASLDKNLYIKHFGYSNSWSNMSLSDGKDEFYTKLKEQIDNELPVILSLDIVNSIGHMVVADGYQETNTGTELHINMGWGESYNVFYNLNTNFQAATYTFDTTDISMTYNIKPCNENNGDCYKDTRILENGDTRNGYILSGKFNEENDEDSYEMYLSGITTFIGDSSIYSNQAFIIKVTDNYGKKVVYQTSTGQSHNITSGKYTVSIFEGGYGHTDNHGYSVTVTTSDLNQTQKDAADIASMRPPAIDQDLETKVVTGDEATKVYINGYASNPNDTLSFKAIANNGNVQLCTNNNILTITPTVTSGHSKIKVIMTAGTSIVEKEFDLFLSNQIYLGKKEYSLTDSFDNQDDTNIHEIYLEGICSILGYVDNGDTRTFRSFFANIKDSNNEIALSTTTDLFQIENNSYSGLSGNYASGIYNLTTSLKNNNSFFTYDDKKSTYIIDINCPSISTDTSSLVNQTGISLDTTTLGSNNQNFCPSSNTAPSLTGTPDTTVTVGSVYSFTPTATDTDTGDTLSYSITNKPTWASFSESTGTLTGTPSSSDVGTINNIVISVSDSFNATTSLSAFSIEVKPLVVNTAPSITGTPDTTVTVGSVYSFTPTATDTDSGDTLSYSITNKPTWASFSESTGTLTGTPSSTDVGTTNNIVISVSDSFNATTSLSTFSITVNDITNNGELVNLIISKNWNLVSLPIDLNVSYDELNVTFPTAGTIWKYDSIWKAYGKGEFQKILDDGNYTKISKIQKGEGFWINSMNTDTIEFTGDTYTTSIPETSGWYLLGVGEDINVTDIQHSNLNTVWVYENGWKAYAKDQYMKEAIIESAQIQSLSVIKRSQGFWLHNK